MNELQNSNLISRNLDRDLMVLDDIVDDINMPTRDWDAIITLYNSNNKPFPLSPLVCSKIIELVKKGRIPSKVFQQFSANYTAFNTRYGKSKAVIEELAIKNFLSEQEWMMVDACRREPYFILGQDIERARAYHFNESCQNLEIMSSSASTYIEYLKLIHPEEFTEKKTNEDSQIVIKIDRGLLEAI